MNGDTVERWVLRIAGFTGLAVFAVFFAFTWWMPQWVEDFGAAYIESEVIERVEAQIDALAPRSDAGLAGALAAELYRRNEQQINEIKAEVKARVREQVRDPNCDCRRALDEFRKTEAWNLAALVADGTGLTALINSHYVRVVGELKREIRIFTGINALSFVLLLLISFAKPAAARHLLFPGVLLLCATLFCAWLYLFSQNWLITIIQGSYVGFAYAAYLGLVYAFLLDIAFNRGRVTTAIANGVGETIGIVATMSPC